MRFMNAWDIDEACRRYEDHPILGPAARTLRNLEDAADRNSDGWAYWPKPARAAARLMELIERNGTNTYRQPERPDVTVAEYRKALAPIKAFRTRSGIDFEIEEVTDRQATPLRGRHPEVAPYSPRTYVVRAERRQVWLVKIMALTEQEAIDTVNGDFELGDPDESHWDVEVDPTDQEGEV